MIRETKKHCQNKDHGSPSMNLQNNKTQTPVVLNSEQDKHGTVYIFFFFY